MENAKFRLRIIIIISLIISFIYIIRIVYISTRSPDFYKTLDSGQFTLKRGDIIDRNGRVLATSDELESLFANPNEIKSPTETALKLSRIINIPQKEIENKLKDKKSFIWIKRQLMPAESEQIKKEKITGVGLKKEFKRFYSNKNLASQIIGFCDLDSRGVEGIEKSMDSYLISDMNIDDPQSANSGNGLNVELTIDSNIQAFAEKSLSEEVKRISADFGMLVLLDGYTGEVISMANYPDFDPNNYREFNQKSFRNNTIFHQFEPGSIMKVFSLLSMLDNQNISENDFFYCSGSYEKNGITVKCTGVHHSINYNGIIKYSCNAAMLEAAERIKAIDLLHYLKQFGFGARTSIMLPGEQPGILRDIDKWSGRSMLAVPMGQEISANALQITRAATVLINDGILVEPYIVKNIINNENKIIKSFKRSELRRVVRAGVSKKMIEAMKSTTDVGGTNRTLSLEGLEFAAKSGTGQIYDFKTNKYQSNEADVTSSLLTVFPYSKPRYILYIAFSKPRSKIMWGGVIGSITVNNFLINLTGYMDIYKDGDFTINKKDVKIKKEYEKVKSLPALMPDLTGLTSQDVFDIFSDVKVDFRIFGKGKVARQAPLKGESLKQGDVIKIYLGE